VAVVGDDNSHRITDEAHLVGGEDPPLHGSERRRWQQVGKGLTDPRQVSPAESGHDPVQRPGCIHSHAADPSVGNRAAKNRRVLGLGQVDIGKIPTFSDKKAPVLDAAHGLPDHAVVTSATARAWPENRAAICSPTATTASTIPVYPVQRHRLPESPCSM